MAQAAAAARRVLRRVPGVQRAGPTARFGDLRRTQGLTTRGSGCGTPVDRWYLERWLDVHAPLVRGCALEVRSDHYASRLGATTVEVVDIGAGNPEATIVGDRCDPATLQPRTYAAVVVTQTLQLLPDPVAALRLLLAALRPGGVLLLTVPCLSRICIAGDLWRWTPEGLGVLLDAVLPPGATREVTCLGNGLTARAFLFGLAAQDLDPSVLAANDPDLPLLACAVVRSAP